MKVFILSLFLTVVSVYCLEDSDLGIKPKRGLGFSVDYHHASPLLGHSYVAPAPAIVHHAAPVLAAPAIAHAPAFTYAHAPVSYGHAPLALAHAPLSYAHAPLTYSHAPLSYGHAPYLSSLHHYKK